MEVPLKESMVGMLWMFGLVSKDCSLSTMRRGRWGIAVLAIRNDHVSIRRIPCARSDTVVKGKRALQHFVVDDDGSSHDIHLAAVNRNEEHHESL